MKTHEQYESEIEDLKRMIEKLKDQLTKALNAIVDKRQYGAK